MADLQTLFASPQAVGQRVAQTAPVAPPAAPDPVASAIQQYPILGSVGLTSKYSNATAGDARQLEFWPPGEPGDASTPRPKEFAPNKIGVEVFNRNIRPIDVLGDVVSHHLVKTDPQLKQYYEGFASSLTPQQQGRLRDQYEHAKANEGEKRSFDTWKETSGIPAYFRGYAFKQWPEDVYDRAYTKDQRSNLDEMMSYLSRR